MENLSIPATLNEAISSEPLWLQVWVMLLVIANLAAIPFALTKVEGAWKLRKECLAIIVSFIAAAILMNWMYDTFGYVRLLGMAHLIAWTPAFVYVLMRRKELGMSTAFAKYLHFYLIVAGLSLAIDFLDVVRYFLGDGELYLRWAS
tara:strand:- start:1266 stop:1706 length:441 start_codon:yes stop_codon:yes gene_type:complete